MTPKISFRDVTRTFPLDRTAFTALGGVTLDVADEEFLELHNLTGAEVKLYDADHPANVWRLANAISFEFPANTTVPADGYLVVVPFDPLIRAGGRITFEQVSVTTRRAWLLACAESVDSLMVRDDG